MKGRGWTEGKNVYTQIFFVNILCKIIPVFSARSCFNE